jgi:RNA polymerase sigma-70 factor (ECF subfamily)
VAARDDTIIAVVTPTTERAAHGAYARGSRNCRAPMLEPSPDLADVAAALAGDASAYGRIVRRHQDHVARRMGRFTRDRGVVKELVHEVFVQAWFSLHRYRGDAPLDHWLQPIATRVGYRYWKAQAKRRTQPIEAASDAIAPSTADHGLLDLVDRLPPRDRLALTLLYVDGLSVAEAAEQAGWSQTMVKVQAFRARGKLKQLIVDHDLVPEGVRSESP